MVILSTAFNYFININYIIFTIYLKNERIVFTDHTLELRRNLLISKSCCYNSDDLNEARFAGRDTTTSGPDIYLPSTQVHLTVACDTLWLFQVSAFSS